MSRAYRLYLEDILRALDRIDILMAGRDKESFTIDDVNVDGVLFNLITIGEAVKNIPDVIRDQIPEVRWRDIGRFRDRVVHHYFALDMGIVWEIVQVHLPVLRVQVEALLNDFPTEE